MKTLDALGVKLSDIPPEGLSLELNIGEGDMAAILEAGPDDEAPPLLSPLRGDLFLRKLKDERLSVKGGFRATVEMVCDRCLANASAELKGSVNEKLDLLAPGARPPDDPESDSDGDLEVRNGAVNLSGLLGEWFWVAWPFNFICKPDCAGLCPKCGADLNEGPCECGSEDN